MASSTSRFRRAPTCSRSHCREKFMNRVVLTIGVALILSLSLSAQRGGRGGGAAAGPANPFAGNLQAIDEGRAIYNQTCTACHGPDGAAGEMGPALGMPARRYAQATDAQIFDAIKNGISGTQMLPFGSQLSDTDMWKVTSYIHGLRGTA